MSALPAAVRRHLPGEAIDWSDPRGRSRVIGVLLERGDREALGWLGRELDAETLANWCEAHAVRRLTRRSRAFWTLALGRPQPSPDPAAEALWPLA